MRRATGCHYSLLKSSSQPKIAKKKQFKDTKTAFLEGGQCLLYMISSMSVPICNRFHTKRANRDKIMSFIRYPYLTLSFEKNPRTQGHEILSQKTSPWRSHGENFVILACTV